MQMMIQTHLDWSMKQGRILTAAGKAVEYYKPDTFTQDELPHYYLLMMRQHTTNETFHQFRLWKQQQQQQKRPLLQHGLPIVGAWHRTIFVGGWEYSSDQEECVFNLQSNNLFIDMRIPNSRDVLLRHCASWDDCSDDDLRMYARQHVFSGFTCATKEESQDDDRQWLCTRHHCLDWNLIRTPRPRPNKWYVQLRLESIDPLNASHTTTSRKTSPVVHQWKEWAFATDPHGQHYYMEQWNRIPPCLDDNNIKVNSYVLALRKAPGTKACAGDGVLIVADGCFSYIFGRQFPDEHHASTDIHPSSLVELVDSALERNDRELALTYLQRIEAGHGRITTDQDGDGASFLSWKIEVTIPPWKQDRTLLKRGDIRVEGRTFSDCRVYWKGDEWELYDHRGFDTLQDLRELFLEVKL